MLKQKIIAALMLPLAAGAAAYGAKSAAPAAPAVAPGVSSIKVGGYPGKIIDLVLAERVKKADVASMVDVFGKRNDHNAWATEFWGKWAIGASDYYRYTQDPQLRAMIAESVKGIISHQDKDGYIGNYKPEAELQQWDVWGRKYVVRGLLAWYDASGDKAAVKAAERQIDRLIAQLDAKGLSIVETGNYRGMPSASILDAVVKLYTITKNKKYLDFSEKIAADLEGPKGPQLIAKTLQGIAVARRFSPGSTWYNFNNGQKAYEMMSCLQGLLDLYAVNGNAALLDGVGKAVDMIISQEINIAGSGASAECWYGGAKLQTRPAIHEMETCVTVTWINLLRRMIALTHQARYADCVERTIYNALFASLKGDGTQIDKYTPLEGVHTLGVDQCGLHMNCCNANGPRGFAAIPQTVYSVYGSTVDVNLYMPGTATLSLQGAKSPVSITQEGDFPLTPEMRITVNPGKKPARFTLRLRLPSWSAATAVKVNGQDIAAKPGAQGYAELPGREWKSGDTVSIQFDLSTRIVSQDGCIAAVRGPIVLARDARFHDGDIDEVAAIPTKGGVAQATVFSCPWAWIAVKIPVILGVDYEQHGAAVETSFCNFSSAGNSWERADRYRVWLPQIYNTTTEAWKE